MNYDKNFDIRNYICDLEAHPKKRTTYKCPNCEAFKLTINSGDSKYNCWGCEDTAAIARILTEPERLERRRERDLAATNKAKPKVKPKATKPVGAQTDSTNLVTNPTTLACARPPANPSTPISSTQNLTNQTTSDIDNPSEPATNPTANQPSEPAINPTANQPSEPAINPTTNQPSEPAINPSTNQPSEPAINSTGTNKQQNPPIILDSKELSPAHFGHLIKEGFTGEQIDKWIADGLVCSLQEEQALAAGFKLWNPDTKEWFSSSGIFMRFTDSFGQLRVDTPIPRPNSSLAKYITPVGYKSQAMIPANCKVITEGWKDAQAGTEIGQIPTGAIAGVSHYRKALIKNAGYTILFDHDGCHNPSVFTNLFHAGLWVNGKIQLIPEIVGQPKAGLCEYFKAGHTPEDYKKLIDSALTPHEFLMQWPLHWQGMPDKRRSLSVRLALKLAATHLDSYQQEDLIKRIAKATGYSIGLLRTDLAKAKKNLKTQAFKGNRSTRNSSPGKGGSSDWNNSSGGNDNSSNRGNGGNGGNGGKGGNANFENNDNIWNEPTSWNGQIGYWKYDEDGEPSLFFARCNFDFYVEAEVADSAGGGFVLAFKHSSSPSQCRLILNSTDHTNPDKFVDALKRNLHTSVVCNLNKEQLNALIHKRQEEYRINRNGKIYRRIECYGQQPDGTWVMKGSERDENNNLQPVIYQFTKNGQRLTEEESGWVFAEVGASEDEIPCPELAPENPEALRNLLKASQEFFGEENLSPLLMMIGWVVAGLHSQEIYSLDRCFPLLNAYGEPGSCKTLAGEAALSLIGINWPDDGMLSKSSISALYEHGSKTGSLPMIMDDPPRNPEIDEVLKTWYNWKSRKVRGNTQKPKSPLGVISNHVMSEDQAAGYTRNIRVPFKKMTRDGNSAFQKLRDAQRTASGAFPQLLRLEYKAEAVNAIELELLLHLPKAHARIAKSLAITIYYASKVIEEAGFGWDIKRWVIQNLCPAENDADSAGDSLKDFVELIQTLKARGEVGDWNLQRIVIKEEEFVAIRQREVWTLVDRHFKPTTYNLKALKPLVQAVGGRTDNQLQWFNVCKEETKTFYNKQVAPTYVNGEPVEPQPPRRERCKCWLIPGYLFDNPDSPPNSPPPISPPPDSPPPNSPPSKGSPSKGSPSNGSPSSSPSGSSNQQPTQTKSSTPASSSQQPTQTKSSTPASSSQQPKPTTSTPAPNSPPITSTPNPTDGTTSNTTTSGQCTYTNTGVLNVYQNLVQAETLAKSNVSDSQTVDCTVELDFEEERQTKKLENADERVANFNEPVLSQSSNNSALVQGSQNSITVDVSACTDSLVYRKPTDECTEIQNSTPGIGLGMNFEAALARVIEYTLANSPKAITVVMATLTYEMNLAVWQRLNHHQRQGLTRIVFNSLKECQIQEQLQSFACLPDALKVAAWALLSDSQKQRLKNLPKWVAVPSNMNIKGLSKWLDELDSVENGRIFASSDAMVEFYTGMESWYNNLSEYARHTIYISGFWERASAVFNARIFDDVRDCLFRIRQVVGTHIDPQIIWIENCRLVEVPAPPYLNFYKFVTADGQIISVAGGDSFEVMEVDA
ncbi:hypothetical protein NG798_24775 [Ancylothrix sp. C2]|uniref:hypothetical protein n=1 Tax=Ancylothrix sp. D3o TaxID=2953691 RepID=UPI0021BAB7A1|nr:hypothetical protein [Ancylothrix sp. D3o]MCT7953017.1 hypothetical protein [Ancylothrix sp. D3o]